jgi:hypothetical protein
VPIVKLRLVALVLFTAVVAGCDSEQEAVPLSLSVPVALILLGALPACWIGGHLLVRGLGRRVSRRHLATSTELRLRWPGLTAALAVAPVAAVAVFGWPVTCWYVATSYREPTYELFSWEGIVVISAIMGALIAILGIVSSLVGQGLVSGRRRAVIAARVVLGLVTIGLLLVGWIGVAWLPALVLSFAEGTSRATAEQRQAMFSR